MGSKTIYLAGPFFKPDQEAEIMSVERDLRVSGVSFFSPRLECRYRIGDPPEIAKRAFDMNVQHIMEATVVLACLSWPDMGTAWELGLAQGLRIPRVGFTSNSKVRLNLMLRHTVTVLVPLGEVRGFAGAMAAELTDPNTMSRWFVNASTMSYWDGELE